MSAASGTNLRINTALGSIVLAFRSDAAPVTVSIMSNVPLTTVESSNIHVRFVSQMLFVFM